MELQNVNVQRNSSYHADTSNRAAQQQASAARLAHQQAASRLAHQQAASRLGQQQAADHNRVIEAEDQALRELDDLQYARDIEDLEKIAVAVAHADPPNVQVRQNIDCQYIKCPYTNYKADASRFCNEDDDGYCEYASRATRMMRLTKPFDKKYKDFVINFVIANSNALLPRLSKFDAHEGGFSLPLNDIYAGDMTWRNRVRPGAKMLIDRRIYDQENSTRDIAFGSEGEYITFIRCKYSLPWWGPEELKGLNGLLTVAVLCLADLKQMVKGRSDKCIVCLLKVYAEKHKNTQYKKYTSDDFIQFLKSESLIPSPTEQKYLKYKAKYIKLKKSLNM